MRWRGGLVAWARLDGLTWSQLGLGRDRLGAGCRWALGAIGVVAGVYVVGVLLPLTRPAFQDVRYDLPLAEALRTAFVVIPFGTVALEELAFRSVLWGCSRGTCGSGRCWSRPRRSSASGTSCRRCTWARPTAGCPTRSAGAGAAVVVVGTVVLTTIGGLVFGELRRRSGSVLASAGAHWATNALGVLFGLVAWRLDPQR